MNKTKDIYPDVSSPNLQKDLFEKIEFHSFKTEIREPFQNFEEKKQFLDNLCNPKSIRLQSHQIFPSYFINPDTPYKGLLLYQGVGTGKSGASITIAEKFKPNVEKYGTKITVLSPGPLNKENYRNEIIMFTGDTYKKGIENLKNKTAIKNQIINNIGYYYNFYTYGSFYKKVIGERIIERDDTGKKIAFRKSEDGTILRDESIHRIEHLDNSLLIIDEAHNVINNQWYLAVKKIVANSKNLKIILLTATPMKNLANDIIDLINLLRPQDDQIIRNKVFTAHANHEMSFVTGGQEYLRKMISGYISYLKGADPVSFAKQIEMGAITKGLLFTKVVSCPMKPFQQETYLKTLEHKLDSLDRRSEAICNIVFPSLNGKQLIGVSSKDGIIDYEQQMKSNGPLLNKQINNLLKTDGLDFSGGEFLDKKYLAHFSSKFAMALDNLEQLVEDKKSTGLAFVYSNLVTVGIDTFKKILLINGYVEYDKSDHDGHNAPENTPCYYCGKKKHKETTHVYHPARFMTITGTSDEQEDITREDDMFILDNVFKSSQNKDGRFIKFLLGSRVMNEGISLANIKEIHILDVYWNLGRVEQVIGRGIRWCKHYQVTTKDNPNPEVRVYKYVISLSPKSDTLSADEELYKKAELKYLLVKKVEKIAMEEAIDCPLQYNANMLSGEKFMCSGKELNLRYYDSKKNTYKTLLKKDLDSSSYDVYSSRNEIEICKEIIKNLFKIENIYKLSEILKKTKSEYIKSYLQDKEDLFEDFFVYKALDELLPVTENNFNNFKDIVYNRYRKPGYLIYRARYYIFQPFDQNENVPLYYRNYYDRKLIPKILLSDYVDNHPEYKKYSLVIKSKTLDSKEYNFAQDSGKREFDYVGIFDKDKQGNNVFKIRPRRSSINNKLRATGVPTLKGTVCETKEKEDLIIIAKKLGIKGNLSKQELCVSIKQELLRLEKYSTNDIVYVIIPKNHSELPYPYNLKERLNYLKTKYPELDIDKNGIIKNVPEALKDTLKWYEFTEKNGSYEIV